MKIHHTVIFLLGLLTFWIFYSSEVPMPYNFYEILPIISYVILFEFIIYALPTKSKNNLIILSVLLFPGIGSIFSIKILSDFYQHLPQSPYSSWDISLTYLAFVYLVILYVYSLVSAVYKTRKIEKSKQQNY